MARNSIKICQISSLFLIHYRRLLSSTGAIGRPRGLYAKRKTSLKLSTQNQETWTRRRNMISAFRCSPANALARIHGETIAPGGRRTSTCQIQEHGESRNTTFERDYGEERTATRQSASRTISCVRSRKAINGSEVEGGRRRRPADAVLRVMARQCNKTVISCQLIPLQEIISYSPKISQV